MSKPSTSSVHTSSDPAELLLSHLAEVVSASRLGGVLDLACGAGRNGLAAIAAGAHVMFADRDSASLESIRRKMDAREAAQRSANATYWPVDFEAPDDSPLAEKCFGTVLVFRYLHRPLFKAIRTAIAPGGLVVYETFTVDQPQFGRPTNPDFLLRHGELEDYFADWDILHSQERLLLGNDGKSKQAVAQLVARKPV